MWLAALAVLLGATPARAQEAEPEGEGGLSVLFRFPRATAAPAKPPPLDRPAPLVGARPADGELAQRVVRPFYTRRASADGTFARTQALWPLWLDEREGEHHKRMLFPLYWYERDVHRYGDVADDETDWILFPLLWGGTSTVDGDYFAFVPFYGTLKDQLARDEIRFVAFPVWSQIRDHGYVGTTWFWPIYTRGSGGGREVFRLWPLYTRQRKVGWYDRRFHPWPFVYREEFDLASDRPGRRGSNWPFWTWEHSTARDYRAVLWPFFSVEENHRHGYREVAAPWPFFVRRTGASDKLQLWPFFTGTRNGGRETHRFAGPIGLYTKDTSEDGVARSQLAVALVLREDRITWEATGDRYLYSRVWPLFDYEEWPDGESRTNVLSLLPFRDARGFGYQYAPVYTLYHHERRADGTRVSWALWDLYRHERTAARNEWRLGPLMRYAMNERTDSAEFSLLGGLLGLRSEGDARFLRLAWGPSMHLGRRPEQDAAPTRVAEALPALIGR